MGLRVADLAGDGSSLNVACGAGLCYQHITAAPGRGREEAAPAQSWVSFDMSYPLPQLHPHKVLTVALVCKLAAE